MKNYDIINHVRGESQFIDDLNVPTGTLYATVYGSPSAHGKILNLDVTEALAIKGVKDIITYKDIPGENQIGGIIQDEELLAAHEVHFMQMPIAIVVAESEFIAREASRKIKIEIEQYEVIIDPREAFAKNKLIAPPRVFEGGNVDEAWSQCDFIIEGECDSGGQEHLYLETQGAFAYPLEGGSFKIVSSTQGPTAVQRVASKVLGIPMNKIEVEVLRLGGGFGGKEDQASPWAAMAALAAFKLNKPVKLILPRHDDMRMTGKRHPYSSDYKLGLKADGTMVALEATYYQNSGASADLSPAVLDRTLFHAANAYHIPNVKVTGVMCKTNLPSNTAFRGFGGPQGKFVIESAIFKAAEVMGIPPYEIQKKNLLSEGDEFHFGQKAKHCRAKISWEKMEEAFKVYERIDAIEKYNSENDLMKKGYAFMPICFGISFTNTLMNQASALINIYTDGSVTFTTAAVEMGQGVNAKIKEVISRVLGISHDKIKTEPTNTSRNANTSPTAASSGADLNGHAAKIASSMLKERLLRSAQAELNLPLYELSIKDEVVCHKGIPTELTWSDLVQRTYNKRISLQQQAFYATPNIFFDRVTNKGDAFFYHVYGTAFIEVTVDCLKGTYQFNTVKCMHDFGDSLNEVVDIGQAEGAIIQGLGWMTLEEVIYNKDGRLLSDLLSTYKVPDIHFAPEDMDVRFLGLTNPIGIMGTKAIGEPPLMYGIGGYFAIMNAVKAFRPGASFKISSPYTAEKVLMNLYSNENIDEKISLMKEAYANLLNDKEAVK